MHVISPGPDAPSLNDPANFNADALALFTWIVENWGGTEGLTIVTQDSEGNVGIGIGPASYKLNVNGNVQFGDTGKWVTATNVLKAASTGSDGAQIRSAVSSAANPTYSSVDDTDTGMFFISGNTLGWSTGGVEGARLNSSGDFGLGVTSVGARLHVNSGSVNTNAIFESTDTEVVVKFRDATGEASLACRDDFRFSNSIGELMRADFNGNVLVGKSSLSLSTAGTELRSTGLTAHTVSGTCMHINRLNTDGTLVELAQSGTIEGTITVSGTTVSYNGAHLSRWSQLPGDKRPEILRGSVLTNLDEMILWRGVELEVPVLLEPAVEAAEAVEAIPEEKDEHGNVTQEFVAAIGAVEAKEAVWGTETKTVAYSGGKSDGEKETVEFEGETYEGVVYTEDNEQLNKMEVSRVKGDRNVAGVFQDWDDDDDEYLNDFYCAMTGDFVIRVAKDCKVQRGDLLMSAGDGTACPQEGEQADVVRSCTVAKVTSTNVTNTYDDGSYLVPCVLMAC